MISGADAAGSFHVLESAGRVYDSRPGYTPTNVAKGRLVQNEVRTIDLGPAPMPQAARAAVVNLTITDTSSAGGFLKVYKAGAAIPVASAINWTGAGQTIANSATVAVGGGSINVRCGGNGASTHVIVDVAGWYM